jgi:hypothetical protein
VTLGPGAQRSHFGMLRITVAASAALGSVAALVGAVAGHASAGIGLAVGLVIGSSNGYLIAKLLDGNSSFLYASLLRLAALSAVAVGAALLLQSSAWTVLIGVGAAQLVMVATSVRQGLRA